ncbi:MAG: hypothetical protein ACJ764_12480 [Solirubrobacteraceae bacterium]
MSASAGKALSGWLRTPAVGLLAAAAVAGCGGSIPPPSSSTARTDLPNIPQIETAIANSVLARAHVKVKVLCPAIVPEIKGETFSCIAVATKPKPRTFSFLVTEHGGTYVTYAQTS